MIKAFCDICKQEITKEAGSLEFIEREAVLSIKKQAPAEFVRKHYDLCKECVLKVKKSLEI